MAGHLKATSQFELIAVGRSTGLPDLRTHFQPALVCHTLLLFLSLAVSFGLWRALEASRGANEPRLVFWGTSGSDMTVVDHLWAHCVCVSILETSAASAA